MQRETTPVRIVTLGLLCCLAIALCTARAVAADPADQEPRVGLSASLFATDLDGAVDNVALMWAAAEQCDRYEVQRAAREAGPFKTIYTGAGASWNDYAVGQGTHFYRLVARQNGKTLTSNVASVTTMPMPEGLQRYSNKTTNEKGLPGRALKAGDTYYHFKHVREGKGLSIVMRTSKDGETWQDGPVVMDSSDHPDLADCKLESGTMFYDEVNDQIVWWCHWEVSGPTYGHGRALVATAKPGERFKVHHNYNPMDVQVRDMSIFVDDDKQGYLVTAGNVAGQGANATLYIFRLNKTYDDVTEVVAKVVENGYREAPHILKRDGFYYLFFSQAAGWYPSRGGYISARSLAGPWSEPRAIGNTSTFSSQSGHILEYGEGETHVPVMIGNRWIRGEGTNGNVTLPLRLAEGFAFYDYAPVLLHDPASSTIIPVHQGRLLSQGRPARASIRGKKGNEAEKAFDGDYDSSFESDEKKWPFELVTDLGAPSGVRNVQVSWHIHKGSEAYYTYSIEGSLDGKKWQTLIDRTDTNDTTISKTYGFTSDELPEPEPARYVKLKVHRAHLHNNPNNWYPPTVYEVKVYGDPARARTLGSAASASAKSPQYRMTYRLSKNTESADPAIRKRITDAMDAAVALYNELGEFDKAVVANYSPGTPTADANYNGWINFGGQIGRRVALHEIGHTLGVGQHKNWRPMIKDGKWTGEHALAQLRKFDGPDAVLHADRMHFWPYGLNFDKETSPENERRHVLMVQALRKDMGIENGNPDDDGQK